MVATRGIRTNPHDVDAMTAIGRYGTLSTEDIGEFYPGYKHNSVQKRMRLLSQNGLTQMTKLEVWVADDRENSNGGRIPTLHSLTDQGAALVESQTGERPQRVLRSRPSAATFLHRREIVRVMRAMDLAADAVSLSRPEWVMEQDVWHHAPKSSPPSQRRLLYHGFGNGVTCLPDIACRFRIGKTELALFWEVDLSTEGNKQLRKASKTDGYVALLTKRSYRRYWPDLETRSRYIIWVTRTPRRFVALREVMKERPIAPICRLLASQHLDDPSTLLKSPVWETIGGEQRAMYLPTA